MNGDTVCTQGLCPTGACEGADLAPFLDGNMLWLWEQLARRADRVGDPALCQGTTRITAPAEAAPRAAVLGLLGSKSLRPGQSRTIDLGDLTLRLRNRGTGLTAGVVAAH
ncbi:hypothetical protein ACFWAX_40385, partial [Streptomyces sp. NPDC059956]|uniref:hypothetical protein n=1 Tax=Streptomyces sp. NPDC059956 TaxID=3347015 RepID=UPI00364C9E55